jgi:hypothetical protein
MASTANSEVKDVEIAQTLQNRRKCKYCNYEHWDEFDLRFHEEMHKEYCEEKRLNVKMSALRNDAH